MSAPDQIGQWTKDKLEMLRQYLAAYCSILHTQKWLGNLHYVDAFSGGVWHFDKKYGELVKGSPIIALETLPPFDTFTFIEMDRERTEYAIKPLQTRFPHSNIKIIQGDCNEVLIQEIIPVICRYWDDRSFIFLDPYGLNVHWETVEGIAKTKKCDIFVNFSVSGVFRQCGDKPPDVKFRAKIDKLMGTKEWIKEVYAQNNQFSLLPATDPDFIRLSRNLPERLAKYYAERLRTCFAHVSRPFMMLTDSNSPLYALVLASHAKIAIDKMHAIYKRLERKKGGK